MNSFSDLPREKLLELLSIFSKNWLAMDGLWFQAVEKSEGMDQAMRHDETVWRDFTVIEAGRIKQFLGLPERAGLEGLERALAFRLYSCLNRAEVSIAGNTLTYRVTTCRVQAARQRKNMPFHPCKPVGLVEYAGFAKAIDDRIATECVSCYPDVTVPDDSCVWRFTIEPSTRSSW